MTETRSKGPKTHVKNSVTRSLGTTSVKAFRSHNVTGFITHLWNDTQKSNVFPLRAIDVIGRIIGNHYKNALVSCNRHSRDNNQQQHQEEEEHQHQEEQEQEQEEKQQEDQRSQEENNNKSKNNNKRNNSKSHNDKNKINKNKQQDANNQQSKTDNKIAKNWMTTRNLDGTDRPWGGGQRWRPMTMKR